ncbi:MAG: FtsX-like permease family protein [Clostridiales bacterium]|jgi:putative ABC transport system permease protein|nr:FtsX-like permease family protein [Clostridiales bacterium]
MRKTYSKNTGRTIKETFGRFAAIFAIVALGVGFLAGLLSATPNMRKSFDIHFDETSMYDIRALGDLGFTDDDIESIRGLNGVENVQPGYLADVLMTSEKGNDFAARMHSLSQDSGAGIINRPKLTSGRFPQNSGECVIINMPLSSKSKFNMGNILSVSENNKNTGDVLSSTEYTIVGFADYSPYFSVEKEYTSIGSGSVDLFLLVPEDSFATDFYTDVYITVSGARELNSMTGAYKTLVGSIAEEIGQISGKRCEIRHNEFINEAEEKLNDAKAEYEKAKGEAAAELSDAERQLADGWHKIDDGEKKLSDAWEKISVSEKELNKNEAELKKQEISLDAEFEKAEKKLDEAQNEIDKNQKTLNKTLTEAQNELNSYKLSGAQQSSFDDLRRLVLTYPSLAGDLETLQNKSGRLDKIALRLTEISTMPYEEQLKYADEAAALQKEADMLQAEIGKIMADEAYAAYANASEHLAMTGASVEKLAPLALKLGSLDSAKKELAKGQTELDARRADFLAQKKSALAQIEDGRRKLSDGKLELANAKNTYYRELSKLNDAKNKLYDSQKEYEESKENADKELADGWQEILDSEAKLSDISTPKWHVFTREDNTSYSSIKANIDKVDSIARVFPIFFFLVAALVALTTMTRMVEDERLQIGTMKALGYSRSAIIGKYVLYALAASSLGSVVGIAVGFRLFPTVIWNIYAMMYALPEFYCPVNWVYAFSTAGAAIICTLLATTNACRSTLKEKPAQLMLPKAPEAGKRVLLERITPIWSRMKFTHKVTARNLFRYKKRFFMTSIGVAGCTALLVTGFGLRDSFSDVTGRQFGELSKYDILAPISGEDVLNNSDLQNLLSDRDYVSGSTAVYFENVTASYKDKSIEVSAFVPDKTEDLQDFIRFRNRKSGKSLDFEEGSVIITEKASEVLKLKAGDTLSLTDNDNNSGNFTVSGICENYVGNYIYMSEDTYASGMGNTAERNMLVIRLSNSGDEEQKSDFGKRLLETGAVSGIRFTSDTKDAVSQAMGNIDMLVVVIIISAGALALVVLYNLTNINISERIKEIATIKVLGFTDREVNAYINRESIMLSVIGTILGLALGVLLHQYVIGRAEMDSMMFGRTVKIMSFAYSAALTMAFSILVDLIMSRKLKNISMVESMKAPE